MGVKMYFSGAEGDAKFFTPLKTIYVQIFDLPHHQISDGGACPQGRTIGGAKGGNAPHQWPLFSKLAPHQIGDWGARFWAKITKN